MTLTDRSANVLGALAQVITDQVAGEVLAATGLSSSMASAISALAEFLDRPTLDDLRKVLGLTPSGAVRLVDRLAASGLVDRQPGDDGRSRTIVLTDSGARVADELSGARLTALTGMLDGLSDGDQEALNSLLARVMGTIVQHKSGGAWICRQCSFRACERAAGLCPAATAARAKMDRR